MKNNGNGVRDFIIENFLYGEDERLQDDTSFLGNSIIDSTGILELVAFLEKKYDIMISDDEIIPDNLDTLTNIDNYLKRKLNGSAAAAAPNGYTDVPAAFPASQQGVAINEPNLLS